MHRAPSCFPRARIIAGIHTTSLEQDRGKETFVYFIVLIDVIRLYLIHLDIAPFTAPTRVRNNIPKLSA